MVSLVLIPIGTTILVTAPCRINVNGSLLAILMSRYNLWLLHLLCYNKGWLVEVGDIFDIVRSVDDIFNIMGSVVDRLEQVDAAVKA